jgi:hypothetical protein
MLAWLRRISGMVREWLSRPAIKSRTHQRHDGAPAEARNSPAPPVLVWGPAYDPLTIVMEPWLRELESASVDCLFGDQVRRDRVELSVRNNPGGLAIFCGHGTTDALLGPPVQPYVIGYGDSKHSRIYDISTVPLGPKWMFAFCCAAGSELGATFSSFEGRVFLGYSEEIGVDFRDAERVEVWKDIVLAAARRMIQDGGITPAHLDVLRDSYDRALTHVKDGFMRTYLLRQKKLLCLHGGN